MCDQKSSQLLATLWQRSRSRDSPEAMGQEGGFPPLKAVFREDGSAMLYIRLVRGPHLVPNTREAVKDDCAVSSRNWERFASIEGQFWRSAESSETSRRSRRALLTIID